MLKERLRTCLLSPNLSKYLDGLAQRIWVCAQAADDDTAFTHRDTVPFSYC